MIPRMVFELPNKALPSINFLPPSRGQANLEPSNLLAITGAPLARSNKNRILAINTALGGIAAGLHH